MDDTSDILIRVAVADDCAQLAELRASLWPESSVGEHRQEMAKFFEGSAPATLPAANFVAETGSHVLVGFVEGSLRSHADGCDPSHPAGYIEGWYVSEEFRHQGIGGKLMAVAEDWARGHGCSEMASDALIDNHGSQRAHEAQGYSVVDRCVHYRKRL